MFVPECDFKSSKIELVKVKSVGDLVSKMR